MKLHLGRILNKHFESYTSIGMFVLLADGLPTRQNAVFQPHFMLSHYVCENY